MFNFILNNYIIVKLIPVHVIILMATPSHDITNDISII